MSFQLWSQVNPEAKKALIPDFGVRQWSELSKDEKYNIWKHLEQYLFHNKPEQNNSHYADSTHYAFKFYAPNSELKRKRVDFAIAGMNYLYKARNFTRQYLERGSHTAACADFYRIFMEEDGDVVLELLSLYCKSLISENDIVVEPKEEGETEEAHKSRIDQLRWEEFDEFASDLNNVVTDFFLNVHLTRTGFVPKQEKKIIEIVYEPVLKVFGNKKWKEVSQILSDAFAEYRKNTPAGYSNCVTNTVAAVQAFLQILVNGQTGKGEISKLIVQAQVKSLIPADMFTKEVFKTIESVLMKERQETGVAHPKKEYATDKNAQMVLNLAMVFFQHCIVR